MDSLRDKIPDAGLRSVARSNDDQARAEVIIELHVPPTAAPPRHVREGGASIRRPRDRAAGEDEPFDSRDAEMDRLQHALEELRPLEPLVRLKSAHAFATTMSPSQLRATAALPLTGVIRPSRTHRVQSGAK
jgi:hypothetical protein